MTENVENLILEHCEQIQASLDRIDRNLSEFLARPSPVQAALLRMGGDQREFGEERK
jgi:hypothetical protein